MAYKDHVSELVDISSEDRDAFFEDVARASNAIHKAFHPDKVNYGAYGDGGCHLHFHLVPKYRDQFEWATTFAMNPGKTYLTEAEYAEMIQKLRITCKTNEPPFGAAQMLLSKYLIKPTVLVPFLP